MVSYIYTYSGPLVHPTECIFVIYLGVQNHAIWPPHVTSLAKYTERGQLLPGC